MLSQLLLDKNDASFSAKIKDVLLKHYKTIIYQYLQPQMGGFINEDSVSVSILSSEITEVQTLVVKCSVFYIEQIGGCNCHDEPHAENGYCEIIIKWNEDKFEIE